ncbi:MAG TPA: HAMP domain-containing sensor histidine kinase [Vicinamibacterales bacterium]
MAQAAISWRRRFTIGLAIGALGALGVLSWYGYRAIVEWRNSSLLVVERRTSEAADLMLQALLRDMRGVQQSILTSTQWIEFAPDHLSEASSVVAGAFAIYPYPESFFIWQGEPDPARLVFFNRSDRRPGWSAGDPETSGFPVITDRNPEIARELQARIGPNVSRGRPFAAFEITNHNTTYQVVAEITYRDAFHENVLQTVGFIVNLDWVRAHYFGDLIKQVAAIGGGPAAGINVNVADPRGRRVSGGAAPDTTLTVRRPFMLFFFDPLTVVPDPPLSDDHRWDVEVAAANDTTLEDAVGGANRTLLIGGGAALVLIIGLVLTVRAERAAAQLAELRSDFVSTVTHELKTPIATIRAAAETLSGGRLTRADMLQDYGQIVVVEAKRLTRLIENLLAYARITDVADVYSFERLDLGELIEEVHQEFQAQLHESECELIVAMPAGLPAVRGDRLALRLLFNNVVDNALRYSQTERRVEISGGVEGGGVVVRVTDHGMGIPADELTQITKKFIRGRHARPGGSGLGLAIASRIASDHGAILTIQSVVDKGTTVSVELPPVRA